MRNRIVYLLGPTTAPFGGFATIYRHVEILNTHGFTAFVGLETKQTIDFYGSTAPLFIHGGHLHIQPGDVFVIPEVYPHAVKALLGTPARRMMFCQNQYTLPFASDPQAGIAEFGVHGVIASSQAVCDFFRDVYGVKGLPLLPYAIDPARFRCSRSKKRQIALMPRKLPQDASFIESVFKRRHARYADVKWLPIDGLAQQDAARLMGESACFLSLSHKESFGLPPLEAMACDCLVAGFHGDGGREYMTPENGWWAETGDYKACADGLAAALEAFDTGGPVLETRRAAMAATVEHYSLARLESALLTFWHSQLTDFKLPEDGGQKFDVTLPTASWSQDSIARDWIPPVVLRGASKLRHRLT